MYRFDQAGRATARSVLERPAASVDGLVEYFWLCEVEVRQAGWRVVPDTSAHLLYHAVDRAGEKNSLVVVGARTRYTDIDLTARRFTVGARLRPGALSVLTTRHAHGFTDLAVPLAQLDQAWADQLYRALESAPSPRAPHRLTSVFSNTRCPPYDTLQQLVGRTPRMAEWLLERVLPRTDFADGVVGDLREEYALRGLRPGAHVRAWYWGQALSLIIRLVSFGCGLVPRILFCALARRAGGGS